MKDMRSLVAAILVFAGFLALGCLENVALLIQHR
jgi:hypothetical protein